MLPVVLESVPMQMINDTVIILVTYCITNHPKTQWLDSTTNLSPSPTVPVGEEVGRGSTGHLWLRLSYEVTVKVLAKAEVTGRLAWGGRLCFLGGLRTGWLSVGGLDPSAHGSCPHGPRDPRETARQRQRDSQAEAICSALGSELYNITCAAFRSLEESLIQTPLKGGGALDLEGRVSKDWG